jgi:hypothetical protein
MPFILSENQSNTDFQPAPQGQYQAVCVDVIDYGVQETSFGPKPKLGLVFQIEGERMTNGNRYTVYARFTASLHEKAKLRQFLEMWQARPFAASELQSFDIERLIGANAYVQIIHNESGGKTYANIQTIMPVNPQWNMPKLEAENYTRKQDREQQSQPQRAAVAAPSPAQSFSPRTGYAASPAPSPYQAPTVPSSGFNDDDIPF